MKENIYREELHNLIYSIDLFYNEFLNDAKEGYDKNNKSAIKRARVNTLELTKLLKEFRKITLEDEKRSKKNK